MCELIPAGDRLINVDGHEIPLSTLWEEYERMKRGQPFEVLDSLPPQKPFPPNDEGP